MTILAAENGDIDALAALETLTETCYSLIMLEGLLKDPRVKVYKAVDNNLIAGYISVEFIFDEASVNNVVVAADFRRSGVATALIERVIDDCRYSGGKALFLEVNEFNVPAIALYEKLGFRRLGLRKNYYGKIGAILYRLDIC